MDNKIKAERGIEKIVKSLPRDLHCENAINELYVRQALISQAEKHHHQLQKAREELIQEIYDEFNWLNTNNAIPDSEIGKGDLHWEMLQKISSDTRRELQARLIKVATEHNVTLNAYHHHSELDQAELEGGLVDNK